MDAWRIYSAAKRHKYVIALSVIVAAAAAIIVGLFLPTYYTANATLLPSERAIRGNTQDPSGAPGPSDASTEGIPRETRMADLVMLAKSRTIAERVSRHVRIRPTILMERVDTERIFKSVDNGGAGNSDLLRVTARFKNPNEAIASANSWAGEFVQFYDEVSHREAAQTRRFLEDELNKAKAQLNVTQNALGNYRKQHFITDLPTEVDSSLRELSPLKSERDSMLARVAEINAKLAVRRSQLRGLSPTRKVNAQEVPSSTIEALRKSIAESKAELIKLSQTYTDDYYRVKELKNQIAAAENELNKQLHKVDTVVRVVDDPSYQRIVADVSDLEADTKAGQARLSRLEALVSNREAKLGKYSGVGLPLDAKRRDYEEAERRYLSLTTQVHTARINERISTETGAIKLIDPARVAEGNRVGPSLLQLVACAALLGLLIGLGVVVLVETLDTRVRTASDASDMMGLPVTGIIPSIPHNGHPRSSPALITQNSPMSPYAESYRFLATEVLLDAPPKDIRSIMVATAKPHQGGTATLCNLAITLAQAGRKVALIDADMRRPSLHILFGLTNDFGLADVLNEEISIAKALKVTHIHNLMLLTAGTNIDNPWALLRSNKMPEVIENLKCVADYVLVDTPSAIVFADAATLASLVDGVIVVVRANEPPRGTELQVKNLLDRANANVMGVVLNDVPTTDVDSCHYYANYYATPGVLGVPPLSSHIPHEEEFTWTGTDSSESGDRGMPK